MKPPIYYEWNPNSHLFIGSGFAQPNPRRPGEWLLPAHSTFDAPWILTEEDEGMAVYRTADGQAWEVRPAPPAPAPELTDIERAAEFYLGIMEEYDNEQ